MPSTRPETVVSSIIDTATALTEGTDLFKGPPRPWKSGGLIPRNCVFVYGMFSFMPMPYIRPGRHNYREFMITVYVRREQDHFEAGQTLARSIWDALQQVSVSAWANDGYVGILMAAADPQYIGMDDDDDHRWVLQARVMFSE